MEAAGRAVRAASLALACSALLVSPACAFVPRVSWGYGLANSNRLAGSRRGASHAAISMNVESAEIFMPALSSTMTEGKIVEWTVKVGDKIKTGQTVMVVESDKADMDVEAFEDGYLAKILVPEGQAAAVGAPVAVLAKSQDQIAAVQASSSGTGDVVAQSAAAPAAAPEPGPAPSGGGLADLGVKTTEVSMPALSSTMTEGKIVEWVVKVGDKVKQGDTVMVVESDKADMDVEAFEEGFIAALLTKAGQSAAVGAPVAVLVENKDDIDKVQSALASGAGVGSSSAPAAAAAPSQPAAEAAPSVSRPDFEFAEVFMPALSSTMTSGKIVQWAVKPGDKISAGQTVMVVESDKADMDVESFEAGVLAAILTKEGDSANVGEPVALIAAKDSDLPALQAYAESLKSAGASAPAPAASASAPPQSAAAPATPQPAAATPAPVVNTGRVVASGYAKKVAGDSNVDLRTVAGSGPGGRIVADDVKGAATRGTGAAAPKPSGYRSPPGSATPSAKKLASEYNIDLKTLQGTGQFGRVTADDVLIAAGQKKPEVPKKADAPAAGKPKKERPPVGPMPKGIKPMDGMQKAVAKNMEKTLDVPIFRVSRTIITDKFDALYKQVKAEGVTVSALLAKAVALALERHPIVNAAYDPTGAIKYNEDINIAMAVALDGGLITPTLRNANKIDLFTLGKQWKELVKKAQEKRLSSAEYSTGTFTISNLGMYGVSAFDAILPPGQGSILAIGASIPSVVVRPDGFMGVQKQMTVTITCDHRHIYGADAAEFLQELAYIMEEDVDSLLA